MIFRNDGSMCDNATDIRDNANHERTKMKTNRENQTAEDAYMNAHQTVQAAVERIGELLFDLPAPDSEVAINWSHVAELNEVNTRLSRVIAFLTNTDE